MKNKFVYLVTIILAVLYLAAGHYFAVQGLSFFKEKSPTDVVEARVVGLLVTGCTWALASATSSLSASALRRLMCSWSGWLK